MIASTFKASLRIIILCCVFSSFSYAQRSLSGQVLESENQLPIAFATIVVHITDGETFYKGAVSDEKGKFSIPIEEANTYTVTINFLGRAAWKQIVVVRESKDLGRIYLEPQSNVLNEMEIAANRIIIMQEEDKLIFNVAGSPFNNGYDGMDILQKTPGVMVNNKGKLLMGNDPVTIKINGKVLQLNDTELTQYLKQIDAENIKNIEVQDHSSAKEDGEKTGGIVNIILKEKERGLSSTLNLNYDFAGNEFYALQSGLSFNYGANKWNVYGRYGYDRSKNEVIMYSDINYFESKNTIITNRVGIFNYETNSYQLGGVLDLFKNHTLGMEFIGSRNFEPYHIDGKAKFNNPNHLFEENTIGLVGLRKNNWNNALLNYTWTIDTLGSNLKLYADYSKRNDLDTNQINTVYQEGVFEDNFERNLTTVETEVYAFQTDLEQQFKNKFQLETGLKYTRTNRRNDLLSYYLQDASWDLNERASLFDIEDNISAAYLSLNKTFRKNYLIKGGIRYERTFLKRIDLLQNTTVRQQFNDFFPSLLISKKIKDHTIAFSYNKNLRRPHYFFVNSNVIKINDFRYEIGNPNLRPEYINTYQLSYKRPKQSVAIYYEKTNNAISRFLYFEDDIAFFQKRNLASQTQIGLDYNWFGNIKTWWYLNATTGVYHRKYTNHSGEDSFKRWTGYVSLSNTFEINPTTNIDVSGFYYTPRVDVNYIGYPQYQLDASISKSFFDNKLQTNLSFNDIFHTVIYGEEAPLDDYLTTETQTWRSRTISLSLSYNFINNTRVNNRKNESKNEVLERL